MSQEEAIQYCVEKAKVVHELQGSLVESVKKLQGYYENNAFEIEYLSNLAQLFMRDTEKELPAYIDALVELAKTYKASEELQGNISKLKTFNFMLWDLYKFHIQRAQAYTLLPHLLNKPVVFEVHQVDLTLKAHHDSVVHCYETFIKPLTFSC